jgi:hypothetical protein
VSRRAEKSLASEAQRRPKCFVERDSFSNVTARIVMGEKDLDLFRGTGKTKLKVQEDGAGLHAVGLPSGGGGGGGGASDPGLEWPRSRSLTIDSI